MSTLMVRIRRDIFRSWLKISGYTRSRLADELNISRGRVSQLLNSDQPPSNRVIAGFLAVTRLPFERLFTVGQLRNGGREGRNGHGGRRKPRHSNGNGQVKP